MAGITYDTTELVQTLKDRGLVPDNQAVFNTAAFLRACTQVMWSRLVPDLLRLRQDYLEVTEDVSTSVARNRIPYWAIGGKLEDVSILDSASNETALEVIDQGRVKYLIAPTTTGRPLYYYVEGHDLVLVPAPNGTYTLRLTYMQRPNKLVPTTECGLVSTIDYATSPGNTILNFGNTPSPAFSASTRVDVVAGRPGFQTLLRDVLPTAATATSVTLSGIALQAGSDTVAVGDYVCLTGDACVPQVPAELHAIIAMRGLVEVLVGVGDLEKASLVERKASEEQERALVLLTPRVNHHVKKVVPRTYFAGRSLRRR